ncbi:golgin subfamily A member 6-like protein 4 [Mytilus trossulus]|uniref:golgin subfamily A member 6-like protein 4 n=1 Tax=Mytilus trossulus TaxID=6551 RepID=UPI003005D65D
MAEGNSENKPARREEVLELKIKIDQNNHEREIDKKNVQIEKAVQKNEYLESENEDLKTWLQEEKDLAIKNELKSKAQIENNQKEQEYLRVRIDRLEKENKQNSDIIDRLEKENAHKNYVIDRLEQENANHGEVIDRLNKKDTHTSDEICELKKKNALNSEEIKLLKTKNKEQEKRLCEYQKCLHTKFDERMARMEKVLETNKVQMMEVVQKTIRNCISGDDFNKNKTCNVKDAKNCKISNETYNITLNAAHCRNNLIPNKQDITLPDQRSNRKSYNRHR